jgi:hypothetical protein
LDGTWTSRSSLADAAERAQGAAPSPSYPSPHPPSCDGPPLSPLSPAAAARCFATDPVALRRPPPPPDPARPLFGGAGFSVPASAGCNFSMTGRGMSLSMGMGMDSGMIRLLVAELLECVVHVPALAPITLWIKQADSVELEDIETEHWPDRCEMPTRRCAGCSTWSWQRVAAAVPASRVISHSCTPNASHQGYCCFRFGSTVL